MVDVYKHDHDGVCSVVSSMKQLNNDYNSKITELNSLVSTINSSNQWIDINVKTAFIDSCNSYLKIYNDLKKALDIYTKYLEEKSAAGNELEQTYASRA